MATPPPNLNVPSSSHTVDISIIDTTATVRLGSSRFFQPDIPGNTMINACCYSFLIKHSNPSKPSKYDTLIFDLGVRKDFENGPKVLVDTISSLGPGTVEVEKDVATILSENGVDLKTVGGIIWSHNHFDHTGDPSTFPSTTDLIVGPTFKKAFVPAYPTIPDAAVDERAWAGRELVEISFSSGLKIGQYPAYDFYGDGSFYLLATPGHTHDHISGLARTKADPPEFMFLGGDIAHHSGEFRPTEYLPLPEQISPSPIASMTICPGSLFEAIHPDQANYSTKPFHHLTTEGGVHADTPAAQDSLDKMQEFDAQDNVFVAIAHDRTLYEVVEYFPKSGANEWKAKGWKTEGRWRFLGDFDVKA